MPKPFPRRCASNRHAPPPISSEEAKRAVKEARSRHGSVQWRALSKDERKQCALQIAAERRAMNALTVSPRCPPRRNVAPDLPQHTQSARLPAHVPSSVVRCPIIQSAGPQGKDVPFGGHFSFDESATRTSRMRELENAAGRRAAAVKYPIATTQGFVHSLEGLAVEGPKGHVPLAFRAPIRNHKTKLPFTHYLDRSLQLKENYL